MRGYFDAEGGVPHETCARFYMQLTQKDPHDLGRVRDVLERLSIRCGRLHNPSVRADPHYWPFYVLSASHWTFAERIGSWHPRKRELLAVRCR